LGVLLGIDVGLSGRRVALIEHAAQISTAPAAASARPEAIGQLAGAARLFHADVVQQLPLRDMEAEANFVVEFHN
jgi:hypothetical protein